jgi:hypothetical protein
VAISVKEYAWKEDQTHTKHACSSASRRKESQDMGKWVDVALTCRGTRSN